MFANYPHLYSHDIIPQAELEFCQSMAESLQEQAEFLGDQKKCLTRAHERLEPLVDCKSRNEITARIAAINRVLEIIENDIKFWREIEKLFQNGCKHCKGYGRIRVFEAQDESHLEPCPECSGEQCPSQTPGGK